MTRHPPVAVEPRQLRADSCGRAVGGVESDRIRQELLNQIVLDTLDMIRLG